MSVAITEKRYAELLRDAISELIISLAENPQDIELRTALLRYKENRTDVELLIRLAEDRMPGAWAGLLDGYAEQRWKTDASLRLEFNYSKDSWLAYARHHRGH